MARLLRRSLLATAVSAAWVLPGPALAHAFGQRYDLPLPLDYFLAGGAAVVLLSFIIAVLALRPADGSASVRVLPPLPRWTRTAAANTLATIGVVLFLLVLVAGWIGKQDTSENIAPVLVWPNRRMVHLPAGTSQTSRPPVSIFAVRSMTWLRSITISAASFS